MRVWFNHWFSSAYYFMQSLKKEGHFIIGSHPDAFCIYSSVCDEFYVEPSRSLDYVSYCLSFCKEHKIDVFFPKTGMHEIIQNKEKFKELGVVVICEDNLDTYDLLADKYKTAMFFKDNNICSVPEQYVVNSVGEFEEAYKKLRYNHSDICIKYNTGEGGYGFKRIYERPPHISRLGENDGLTIGYNYLIECLNSVEKFNPVLVMPYMNSPEISADCLSVNNNLIIVPREKISKRVYKFEPLSEVYNIVQNFYDKVKLVAPFNIQFRMYEDKLNLLDVNTRLSGGAWKSMKIGIDFAQLALGKFTNTIETLPDINFEPVYYGNLEESVLL